MGGPLWIGTNAALRKISLPQVQNIVGRVRLEENPTLTVVEIPGHAR